MKRLLSSVCLATALGAAASLSPALAASAAEPGEYDFGEFAVPDKGGEFVEVNVTRELIAIAARLIGKDEPDVAAVLGGLHQVRVNVIGLDDSNRDALTRRVAETRSALAQRGWQRVVTVRESTEQVDVYVKMRGDEHIDGVVVTVLGQEDQAVFVNIVGNIKPEQIVMVGERFGIEPLKELHLSAPKGG